VFQQCNRELCRFSGAITYKADANITGNNSENLDLPARGVIRALLRYTELKYAIHLKPLLT
jgi:hypothetical protein